MRCRSIESIGSTVAAEQKGQAAFSLLYFRFTHRAYLNTFSNKMHEKTFSLGTCTLEMKFDNAYTSPCDTEHISLNTAFLVTEFF